MRNTRKGGHSDGDHDPEGLAQATGAMDEIVSGYDALGDLVDWDDLRDNEPLEQRASEVDVQRSRARSRGLGGGTSAFNRFPANSTCPWRPVFLLILPLDPAPRVRGYHGESVRNGYFDEALWRARDWAHHPGAAVGPKRLLILTDSWPLPPHPIQKMYRPPYSRGPWPAVVHPRFQNEVVRGLDSLHQVLGAWLRPVIGLTVQVSLTPRRGERLPLAVAPAADWPAGW